MNQQISAICRNTYPLFMWASFFVTLISDIKIIIIFVKEVMSSLDSVWLFVNTTKNYYTNIHQIFTVDASWCNIYLNLILGMTCYIPRFLSIAFKSNIGGVGP